MLICIDAGECMDEKTFAELEARVAEDDFKYFITKVGEPFKSKGDVYKMKNGEVQ